MTKEEVFAIWAPDDSPWSPWVKPVLFAHLELARNLGLETASTAAYPPSSEKAALVIDLPGTEGVLAGISLAKQGYRPVPLYNALPLPYQSAAMSFTSNSPVAVLDIVPIISALQAGAEILAQLQFPKEAPPAFLLDANRRGEGQTVTIGDFDNRSISFVTDFPSAEILKSCEISRVILVQKNGLNPQPDIEKTLRLWQDDGIQLERLQLDLRMQPELFRLPPLRWYHSIFSWISSLNAPRPGKNGFGFWAHGG